MTPPSSSQHRIKKAFVLGAGLGTRLLPLTDIYPKPLVPFYHEPLIFQTLRRCREAGIEEVMINTHHLPHTWKEFFPDPEWEGMRLSFSYEPVLLDTGGGIKKVEDWINGEPVLVCNADNLCDFPLSEVITEHLAGNSLATLVLRKEGYNTNVAFDPDSRLIIDIRHCLGIHYGTHQFTGIYCLSPELLRDIPEGQPISIIDTLLLHVPEGKVRGLTYDTGYWLDLGTLDNYIDAHKSFPGVKIHPDAKIAPGALLDPFCVIGPDASIPADAILSECIVWPHVVIPPQTKTHRRIFM